MLDHNITIIEFLDAVTPKYLESNDITTTKFLDAVLDNFRESNDISVTKFMEDTNVSNMYDLGHDNDSQQDNPLSAGPRNWRSYRRDDLDDEWMSNDYSKEIDHRWLNELEHHYQNDPYHSHYYYDDIHGIPVDNKWKKGGKGKGKKKKEKKPKEKKPEEDEEEDEDEEKTQKDRE